MIRHCNVAFRRHRALALLVGSIVVVSVVGLRGGVSSANSDPADASAPVVVVTPPQARKIVEQFWPKRERARAHNDLRETRELETGAALELDNAVGADNQLLGGANLRWERPLHGFDVIVTRQTTYPAWFFASGLTNRNIDEAHPDAKPPADYLEMMVFTKQAAEAPWKQSLAMRPRPLKNDCPSDRRRKSVSGVQLTTTLEDHRSEVRRPLTFRGYD